MVKQTGQWGRWLKRGLWVAFAVGTIAALAVAFRPRPIAVDMAVVTLGRFEQTLDEDGKTRVRQRYVVSAPLSGMLDRITLRPGDAVRDGTVLANMVPMAPPLLDARARRELRARLAAAQAARQRAEAHVDSARAADAYSKLELGRTEKLKQSGSIPQSDLDRIVLERRARAKELDAARFGARVAEHEVDVARAALEETRATTAVHAADWPIRSPVAGEVLRVTQESAGVVSAGTPLLELADPAALEVVVDALTTDAVQIPPGAAVRIEQWGGPRPLEGRIRRIEPAAFTKVSALGVEEQRVNVLVDILSPHEQWTSLGDGFRVEVSILLFSADKVLTVPMSAVFRNGKAWAAFVVEDGRARKRPVMISHHTSESALIVSGLSRGERVIVYPSDAIADGVRVAER